MNEHTAPNYALFAIKYAHSPQRQADENFLTSQDVHDGPMPLDFFIWVAVAGERVVLIDSGADEATCSRRGHTFLRNPADALQYIGLAPEDITDLVVTHMHWDHMGNLERFPNAQILIHKQEIEHATGCSMCHPMLRRPYDVEQVCDVIRALYAGRVRFNKGDIEIAPGLTAHLIGGHTPGLQVVRVKTQRGNVVLASDALHFYANALQQNPFPIIVDVADYLDGITTLTQLADSPQHIISGHDPLVMTAFPAFSAESEGIVAQLDKPPLNPLPVIS